MSKADPLSETKPLYAVGRHVVVVLDDEPRVLEAVRRSLRSEPYEVWITTRTSDVFEWAETGVISLLVTDLRLDRESGLDVAREVRRRSERTICVLLTGFPSKDISDEAARIGVRDVLSKPWDEGALRRTLRHFLRERELWETRRRA